MFAFAGLFASVPFAASAGTTKDEFSLDEHLPRSDILTELKKKIAAEPDNLDDYYEYAKQAESRNKWDQAGWAYRQMLDRDNSLHRVRLDLSLVEIQRGHLREARECLETVAGTNPPETVKKNIAAVLTQLDAIEGKGHRFDGAVSTGVNSDTNANSAPSTGNVTIFDTTIPLGAGAREKSDAQGFVSLNMNHAYGFGEIGNNWLLRWQSGGGVFMTNQRSLDELNLQVYSLRSGPEFIYAPLRLRTGLMLGYNHLMLDEQSYLRNPRGEFSVQIPLDEELTASAGYLLEHRGFVNSDTVATYEDRSGLARQGQFGLKYLFSAQSQWEAEVTLRREDAKQNYNANDSIGFALSHTYAFSDDILQGWLQGMFTYARAARKNTGYQIADAFIGSNVRRDDENSYQFNIGKKFRNGIILSTGVSYTDVKSNIQNYRYDNYRYSVTVTKPF